MLGDEAAEAAEEAGNPNAGADLEAITSKIPQGMSLSSPKAQAALRDIKGDPAYILSSALGGAGMGAAAAQGSINPIASFTQGFAAGLSAPSKVYEMKKAQLQSTLDASPLSAVLPELAERYPVFAGMPAGVALPAIQQIMNDAQKLTMVRATEKIKSEEHAAAWFKEHEGEFVNDKNADAVVSMIRANIPDSPIRKDDIKGMKISDFGQFINKNLITADSKEERWQQTEWGKLVRLTNPNNAMRGSLIGTAGLLNARAERALDRLKQNALTPQELDAITTDIAGIMQGGAPHEAELRAQGVHNLVRSLNETLSYFKSNPQAMQLPEWRAKLTEIVKGIKSVDNNIIRNNLDITEVAYKNLIEKNPERWATYKAQILRQIDESDAPKPIPIAEGTKATKLINGKPVQLTYTKGAWVY